MSDAARRFRLEHATGEWVEVDPAPDAKPHPFIQLISEPAMSDESLDAIGAAGAAAWAGADRRCGTCRWWGGAEWDLRAECRRLPPNGECQSNGLYEPPYAIATWPPTGIDGWCGEWAATEAAAPSVQAPPKRFGSPPPPADRQWTCLTCEHRVVDRACSCSSLRVQPTVS